MLFSLKNPYISVTDGRVCSYGGNQMSSDNRTEREVGCGVIAALDLLLYLSHYHTDAAAARAKQPLPEKGPVPLTEYLQIVHELRKRFLPLIPKHGINGLMLTLGLNACFLKRRLPFAASWGVPYARLWREIRRMLEADIPVIFSIGPNFPLFWQHHKLKLYAQRSDGSYVPCTQTHAHYVMITAMDDEWLQVSSWGRKYYIRKDEYLQYVREHSLHLVSNIVSIRKISHGAS